MSRSWQQVYDCDGLYVPYLHLREMGDILNRHHKIILYFAQILSALTVNFPVPIPTHELPRGYRKGWTFLASSLIQPKEASKLPYCARVITYIITMPTRYIFVGAGIYKFMRIIGRAIFFFLGARGLRSEYLDRLFVQKATGRYGKS
ncbi:hypothetical protein BDR22DRAFT_561118 [Usnea florida]